MIGNTYTFTMETVRNNALLPVSGTVAAPSIADVIALVDSVLTIGADGTITAIADEKTYLMFTQNPPQVGDRAPVFVAISRLQNRENTVGITEGV